MRGDKRLGLFRSKLAWFAGQAFFLAFLLIGITTLAQELPKRPNAVDQLGKRHGEWIVYFDRLWNEVDDPLRAVYYRLIRYEHDRPVGVVKDYFRSGAKQWEGTLLKDRPDEYTGLQTWYYKTGEKRSTTRIENGALTVVESFLLDGSPADPDWVTNYYDPAYEAFYNDDYVSSVRLFKQALAHADAIHDRYSEEAADIIAWLSILHHKIGKTEEAMRWDQELLDVYSSIRESGDADLMQAMHDVARGYRVQGQYLLAREAYLRFLDYESKYAFDFHEMHGRVLTGLGEIYLELGKYADAHRVLEEAQTFYRNYPPEEPLEVELLNTILSRAHFLTGNWTEGKRLLLDELKQAEHQFGKASTQYRQKLAFLGNFYKMNGQLREAEACFTTAIGTTGIGSADPIILLTAAIPLIEVYVQLGQAYRADEFIATTRSALRSVNTNTPGYATMYYGFLRRLCDYYGVIGDKKKKEEMLTALSELSLKEFGVSSVEYVQSMSLWAEHYVLQNLPDRALDVLENVVPVLERYVVRDDARELRAMAKLAQLIGSATFFSSHGAMDDAIAAMNTSLRIYGYLPEQTFVPERIDVYLTLAMILETTGDQRGADSLYDRCLKEVEAQFTQSHPYYANMLFSIAKKAEIRKDVKTSRQYYQSAVASMSAYIRDVFPHLSTEEKEMFYRANAEWIENFKSFAVTNVDAEPALAEDLYNLLLADKAVVLRSVNQIRSAVLKENNPVTIRFYEEWAASKNKLVRLYQQGADAEEVGLLAEQISRLEKQLSGSSARFAEWNRVDFTWQDVQASLQEGEAAVEIAHVQRQLMSDSVYVALVITKNSRRPLIVQIGTTRDLETRNLQFYRNAIRFKIEDTRSYDIYWKPVAEALEGVEKVHLSPDGVYHQISLAALYNPTTRRFVGEELEVELVTSTALLLRKRPAFIRPNSAVIIAHPDYGEADALSGDEGNRGFNLGNVTDLPGTRSEQVAISALLKERQVRVESFSETAATEEVAKGVNNPSVLHIATHGFFLEDFSGQGKSYLGIGEEEVKENPLLLSGLLLAGCRNEAWQRNALTESWSEDGILTAFEASTLRLEETELVVLSACDTGLGEIRNGEGVYGLQRAFAMAGASKVAMSLWKVDDAATQEFMVYFYRHWLEGVDVNHAFRLAQRSLKEKYSHPYYWGAFVLVGNQ